MGNEAHLLSPDVAAAAAAIANARGGRRGAPEIKNILNILPKKLFDEVVEDAEAAIAAATAGADAPLAPRLRGPLNAADVSTLGASLDAGTLVILARDRASRPSAATWAAGVGASVMDEHEAGQLWSAFVAVSRKLAEPSA